MNKLQLLIMASQIPRVLPINTTWSLLHSCMFKFYHNEELDPLFRIYLLCYMLPLAEHYTLIPNSYTPPDSDIKLADSKRHTVLWRLGLATGDMDGLTEAVTRCERLEASYWLKGKQTVSREDAAKIAVIHAHTSTEAISYVRSLIADCVLVQKALARTI